MSAVLAEMGYERPKIKHRTSYKDLLITMVWGALAILVGMGIVGSFQAVNPAISQTSVSQGL